MPKTLSGEKMNLTVSIGKLKLKNPVVVASGTFGAGEDYQQLIPLNELGALVTKTITLKPCQGNPPPRIAETPQGMINAIGLENPGVEAFIEQSMPFLGKIGIPVIVSISADSKEEFVKLAQRLNQVKGISAIELNLSCPNLGKKILAAQDARATYAVVRAVKQATKLTLISKLTPNVTDIGEIALAAQRAGSDGLSLVNTFRALAIDVDVRSSKLGNIEGGLSGPAIKPQALWMVRAAYQATKLPIIGMGGIMNSEDALEFILAGASAVACGTVNFVNPKASIEIISGIRQYLKQNKINDIKKLIGQVK